MPPNKALQLTSAGSGVLKHRRPELTSLAGRLVPPGDGAGWATLAGQRRSQLRADSLGGGSSSMNWEAIGAVGEILGAIGVIVTLGYLAVQIRQNTASNRQAAARSTVDAINRLNFLCLSD